MTGDKLQPAHHRLLDILQRESFEYFLQETNPQNGLVLDRTEADSPASIAAVGLALSAYPIGVERGLIAREDALRRTLTTLRFFRDAPHGPSPSATGYRGFYYHFLDFQTGLRAGDCELSTVDTALLLAGMLTAACYFTQDSAAESEVRLLADELYRRADWQWARNGSATVTHGWKPETGFLPFRWEGFDEALILYLLGLGSPTSPLPPESYTAWASTYEWRETYGIEYLFAGPLFTHQFSHVWIDFRGIQDAFMRDRQIDYFENSRRATQAHREYAMRNPQGFEGYGPCCWGLTACEGPGPGVLTIRSRERNFFNYVARGIPDGPDDGTLAPWAVATSLPFAPEIVIPSLQHMDSLQLKQGHPYGFKSTFNPTYPNDTGQPFGWVSKWHYGINQGPIVLMVENYRSGLLWDLMRKCPYLIRGLRRAGFSRGWL